MVVHGQRLVTLNENPCSTGATFSPLPWPGCSAHDHEGGIKQTPTEAAPAHWKVHLALARQFLRREIGNHGSVVRVSVVDDRADSDAEMVTYGAVRGDGGRRPPRDRAGVAACSLHGGEQVGVVVEEAVRADLLHFQPLGELASPGPVSAAAAQYVGQNGEEPPARGHRG